MVGFRGLILLTLLSSSTVSIAAPQEGKVVAWAKQIAEDCLNGVLHGKLSSFGFLSPELAAGYGGDRTVLHSRFAGYDSFKIVSHEIAPDNSEVIFHGVLESGSGKVADKVTIRVAKEGSGRWSIRYMEFKP